MRYKEGHIILRDMKFHAYHGVDAQETQVGADFTLSLRLHTDLSKAAESDRVEDTLNYAEVYQAVRHVMDTPSHLLENVTQRIAATLFTRFTMLEKVEIILYKDNPPVGCECQGFGVETTFTR